LLAHVLNKERLGMLEYLAVLLSTVGSVMIGFHAGQTLDAPALPLLVNCVTPLCLALCISTLRTGAKELFDPTNILCGSVTPIEFTAIKLCLSAFVAFFLALILENSQAEMRHARPSCWAAIREYPDEMPFLLLGGIFVLVFQVNLTWLTGLTSATTVGIVGGLKVVPQWILNAAFQLKVDLAPLNVGGAALVLSASILYAAAISLPYEFVLGVRGLERVPRQSEHVCSEAQEPCLRKVSVVCGCPPQPLLTGGSVIDTLLGVPVAQPAKLSASVLVQ